MGNLEVYKQHTGLISGIFSLSLILVISFTLTMPIETIHAEKKDNDPKIGLKVGQWVKFSTTYKLYGDKSMEKILQPILKSSIEKIENDNGVKINDLEWIKYKVVGVSNNIVTFEQEIKSKNFGEKKTTIKVDVKKFDPLSYLVMPINLELGSKFHNDKLGEVTFSRIGSDVLFNGLKINEFSSDKKSTKNNVEIEITSNIVFDEKTGILLSRYGEFIFTDKTSLDTAWVVFDMTASSYDMSEKSKISNPIQINSKKEIQKRLSEFFIKIPTSRFQITNEGVGISEKGVTERTTYDIILVRDNSKIGKLRLNGDNKISSIVATTTYSFDKKTQGDASDILQRMLYRLTGHYMKSNHESMLFDYLDQKQYSYSKLFDDVKITQSWESEGVKTGIFTLQIDYLDNNAKNRSIIDAK